jgi:hypothetical protein
MRLLRILLRLRATRLWLGDGRHRHSRVVLGRHGQQRQSWLHGPFLLEPRHHAVDLGLRQLDLQALLQLVLSRTLRQPVIDGTSQFSHHGWRDFEWTTRAPLVAHAGGDSLRCHLLGYAADGIDMQPEHTRHFHACR